MDESQRALKEPHVRALNRDEQHNLLITLAANSAPTDMGGGPGRVLVSFTPCDCPPVRAVYGQNGGLGHLAVACREPGCALVWCDLSHERGHSGP